MTGEKRKSAVRKNKELVFTFVDAVNTGDTEKLASMTTDGFAFTDIAGDVYTVKGFSEKKKFWDDYIKNYPKYTIMIQTILSGGTDIAFIGKTRDSHMPRSVEVNEILIWCAGIKDDKIAKWRIFSTEGFAF
ncbi:MAG: nuclear transport factor 2 family protein [candidate division WOR-3 bacterium]|nr:MAG: nuclear transport factor 2 family protein [candidate division WOR-3 bacterium]